MICGLIWLILCLITAGILFGFGRSQWKKWKIMADTPTRMIIDIEPGRVEVNGNIHPVPGGLLYSPLTNIPCVQFEVKVQEYRSSGKSSYWATVHTVKRGGHFLVADGSGKVLVDHGKVKLGALQTMSTHQGMFNEMNGAAQSYIQRLGINEKGFFGVFKRRLRVLESVIPVDHHLYVLGDAVEEPMMMSLQNDPTISPFVIKKKEFMILSFESEKQLSDSKKTAWVLLYVFAGVSIFLGLFGILFLSV
jgi:E3 ubiquitin ligase